MVRCLGAIVGSLRTPSRRPTVRPFMCTSPLPAGVRLPRDVPYVMTSRGVELQRTIVLRMTGAERVRLAAEMSEMARALAIAGLRHRHPEWTDADAQQAYARGVIDASAGRTAG